MLGWLLATLLVGFFPALFVPLFSAFLVTLFGALSAFQTLFGALFSAFLVTLFGALLSAFLRDPFRSPSQRLFLPGLFSEPFSAPFSRPLLGAFFRSPSPAFSEPFSEPFSRALLGAFLGALLPGPRLPPLPPPPPPKWAIEGQLRPGGTGSLAASSGVAWPHVRLNEEAGRACQCAHCGCRAGARERGPVHPGRSRASEAAVAVRRSATRRSRAARHVGATAVRAGGGASIHGIGTRRGLSGGGRRWGIQGPESGTGRI